MKRRSNNLSVHAGRIFLAVVILLMLSGCSRKDRPTPTPTPGITVTPTDIILPTPTEIPDPTATPTPAPVVIPEPGGELGEVSYLDLSKYIGRPASEVVTKINRNYRYEYWGPDHEKAEGGITFDGKVYFAFTECGESFDPDCIVRLIIAERDPEKTTGTELGYTLFLEMNYQQIQEVMADKLHGPLTDDGKQYTAYGTIHNTYYCFTWKQSPFEADVPPDSVVIVHEDLSQYATGERFIDKKAVTDYLESNGDLFLEHKDRYHSELRETITEQPVHRLALLTAIKLDEHNTVEVYESAVLGRAPMYYLIEHSQYYYGYGSYSFTEHFINGYDKGTELYDYTVFLRLMSDGRCIDSFRSRVSYQEINAWEPEGVSFRQDVSWVNAGGREFGYVEEMTGRNVDHTDYVLTKVKSSRDIVEETEYPCSAECESFFVNDNEECAVFKEWIMDKTDAYVYMEKISSDLVMGELEGEPIYNEYRKWGNFYGMSAEFEINPTSLILRVSIVDDDGWGYRRAYFCYQGLLVRFQDELSDFY